MSKDSIVMDAVVESMTVGLLAKIKPMVEAELIRELDKLAHEKVRDVVQSTLSKISLEVTDQNNKICFMFEYKP